MTKPDDRRRFVLAGHFDGWIYRDLSVAGGSLKHILGVRDGFH